MSIARDPAYRGAQRVLNLAWQLIERGKAIGTVPQDEVEELREALYQAKLSVSEATYRLIDAKPDNQLIRWGDYTGNLAHQIAVDFAEHVLLSASFINPEWDEYPEIDTLELSFLIDQEAIRGRRKPVMMTIAEIHALAVELSPSCPSLKTMQNPDGLGRIFGKGRNVRKDYYDILPTLLEKWPQVEWPSQLSNRE